MLPALEALQETAVVVALPMRTRFRGQTRREAMLFRGPAGWGEFAPFSEYGPQESARWLAAGIEAAWNGLGRPRRETIPVNAIMPAVPAAEVAEVLTRSGDPSAIPAVKIKVAEPGQSHDDDVARLKEVRRLAPGAGIRVDANAAWSIPQAVRALAEFAEIAGDRFEYAEQPVQGVEALTELREALARDGTPVPLAADEAVRKTSDPLRVVRLGAADLLIVKVPPLGGVTAAMELVAAAGLPAVVSSALDTSVGLAAGVALAARLPELPYACGLGTGTLLAGDVTAAPLIPDKGALQVPVARQADGDVVVTPSAPEPHLLATHRVTGERERWWRQRLQEAHRILQTSGA
ncbi:o-succinylbenzoate synthase [Nesterenkonia alba]|uniref:o-succinylbenzoate synthase n=1 Tax=Nesterenkonia alba TaxID=515814 RepID=UPI000400FBA6|nr:o-succinylbenzoate synthase [Nesterenkonia alba]